MARDEALLALARETGDGWLRVYGWSVPVLSLGRHQRALGIYDGHRAAALGVQIVRRPTGGRAVLHHRELTYAIAAPSDTGISLRDAAERVDRVLLHALRALGVPAVVAVPTTRAPSPDAAPCFALPVRGEILAGGVKLAGSAQRRDAGAWLQHGSILIDDDQSLIASVATTPTTQQVGVVATLRDLLPEAPSLDAFAAAMAAAICEVEGHAPTHDPSLATRLDLVARPLLAHFADPAWTWRR